MERTYTVKVKGKGRPLKEWELVSVGGPARAARTGFKRYCTGINANCFAVVNVFDHWFNRSSSYNINREQNVPPLQVEIGGKTVFYNFSVNVKAIGGNYKKSRSQPQRTKATKSRSRLQRTKATKSRNRPQRTKATKSRNRSREPQ